MRYKNKPKGELLKLLVGCLGRSTNLSNYLIELKATINLQNSQMSLLQKKVKFLEDKLRSKNKCRTTYSKLGNKHNRDIGTMKRRNRKTYLQSKDVK